MKRESAEEKSDKEAIERSYTEKCSREVPSHLCLLCCKVLKESLLLFSELKNPKI